MNIEQPEFLWRRVGAAIAMSGLIALAVRAEGSFSVEAFLELDDEIVMGAELNEGQDDHTVVEAIRGPLLAGTFAVEPRAKSKSLAEPLTSMRFLVADDDDQNGVLEGTEWTLVSSTPTVVEGAWRVARGPVSTVSAFHDGYRIETVWDHGGTDFVSADTIARTDLVCD